MRSVSSEVIRHAPRQTLNAKRSTSPWRPRRDSPLNAQRSTLNAQRSTLNAQRSTLNAQRSTLNAQPLQTPNLPIMAAQPQSLPPRSGAIIRSASEVICHPSCATRNVQRAATTPIGQGAGLRLRLHLSRHTGQRAHA
ncbi:MAG: hypothetical protein M0Q87_04915 [Ottowia sp.]|nr:hypothetical protein [Ottowia sp.]